MGTELHGDSLASLRDPVDRFTPYYNLNKESSGTSSAGALTSSELELGEWDLHTDDLPWVGQMKSQSVDGLQECMAYPGNHTFNRQSRYGMGFQGIACSDRCCGI